MEEPKDIVKEKDMPAAVTVPETPVKPDETVEAEKEKEKEPEIPIQQVPMDGVCGGY
jgi:hypothetical protein